MLWKRCSTSLWIAMAKRSHEGWRHPLVPGKVTLSGQEGADAQGYQEVQVRAFLARIRAAEAAQEAER